MPEPPDSPGSLPVRPGLKSGFASLQHRQFRLLFVSNTAFFFAMNGQFVVRSYLAYELTHSEFALGLINLVVAVPMLIISPFGGVVSDRFNRKRLVLIGQSIIVMNEVVVLMLLLTGTLAFWHLMAVVAVMGAVFPFIMPARQAMTVDIVGRQGLANAMALTMSAMNGSRVIAPALAGFIIYLFRVEGTYIVAVSVYAIALLSFARIQPKPPVERTDRQSVIKDMMEGMRYVATEPTVRVLMLFSIVPMLLAMPFQTLLVVFAEDIWDTGSRGLGILQASAGLGGMAGSFAVAFLGDSRRPLRIMIAGVLGFSATLLLFAISPWFLLALPLLFIADAFVNVFQTTNGAITQLVIPDEVRGRVMSLMMMTFGLTPLGSVPVAAMAQAWGAPVAVGIAAAVTFGLSVLLIVMSRSLRNLDAVAAEARLKAPEFRRHGGGPRTPPATPVSAPTSAAQ